MIGYCSLSPGNQGIWVSRTPSMLMKSRLLQITWPKIERMSCEMSHFLPFHLLCWSLLLFHLQILSGIQGLLRPHKPQVLLSGTGALSPGPQGSEAEVWQRRWVSHECRATIAGALEGEKTWMVITRLFFELLSLVRCHCAFLEAPGILGHRPWVAWKLWIFAVVDSCPLPVKGFLICCVWKPTRNCFCLCGPMANGVGKKQAVLNGQYYPMGWFVLLMIMYIQLYSATTTIIRNPRDGPLALVH